MSTIKQAANFDFAEIQEESTSEFIKLIDESGIDDGIDAVMRGLQKKLGFDEGGFSDAVIWGALLAVESKMIRKKC